ncbi:MAG TPA: O-antigen ligase family protein, partial [Blastocatellia bacterium]
SCFSYYPLISFNGLRSPAFFLAFYFVSSRVRSMGSARFLTMALVASCLVNVAVSAGQLARGRGIRIDSFQAGSPLAGLDLQVGDIIVGADDNRVESLQDLSNAIDSSRGKFVIKYERSERDLDIVLSRKALQQASGAGPERLGITVARGRNLRVTGFYSHYETYAEVLQLIASLAIGMLIALERKRSKMGLFLAGSAFLISAALILTLTRSALAGLALSIVVMTVASFRPKVALLAALVLLLAAPLAVVMVRQSRGISFVDTSEGSTAYRLEIWREAFGLIKNNPVVGIGKGSDGEMRQKLGLFQNGKLPPGHFHSSPIQVAVWWGLPALALYAAFMLIFVVETWRLARACQDRGHWSAWGMSLGILGALIAFNLSSLVQFNFGDGEVSMALWLLAGLAFAIRRLELGSAPCPQLITKSEGPQPNTSDRNQVPPPAEAFEETGRATALASS